MCSPVTPRTGEHDTSTSGGPMSSADWYFAQADHLRGRADACQQLARRLDGAAVFELRRYSGDTTWQGPVAIEFDDRLAFHCLRLQSAIDQLRVDAVGLSAEADDLERRGTYLQAVGG
jgi:hypothetical protein